MAPADPELSGADGAQAPDCPPPAPTWEEVQEALLSSGGPVVARYRALFHARSVAPSAAAAAEILIRAFPHQSDSVLLRHELAYVLGQLGEPCAAVRLREVAGDESEDDIVRHEAVEALAALEEVNAIALLEGLEAQTSSEPLRHTCELALAGLRRKLSEPGAAGAKVCLCQYTSRDPAEGWSSATQEDVGRAAARLSDVSEPLFARYEGLFTLRNVGGSAAAEALAEVLQGDRSSAVLRHEVAFVLGQMEEESAAQALICSLARRDEHAMVRHEAAIALGAIGTPVAEDALRAHLGDADVLVSQSCEVALATAAYWRAWEELEARISVQQGASA